MPASLLEPSAGFCSGLQCGPQAPQDSSNPLRTQSCEIAWWQLLRRALALPGLRLYAENVAIAACEMHPWAEETHLTAAPVYAHLETNSCEAAVAAAEVAALGDCLRRTGPTPDLKLPDQELQCCPRLFPYQTSDCWARVDLEHCLMAADYH